MITHPILHIKNEKTNPLPPQLQIKLAIACKGGSKKAKEKLIESNSRFLLRIALKYKGRGLDVEDLIQEGAQGLITAADYFNPAKGIQFLTYAVWWVRQGMLSAIQDTGQTIRIPSNYFYKSRNKNPEKERAANEKRVNTLYSIGNPLRLDAPSENGVFTIPDTSPPPGTSVEESETKRHLSNLVDSLPERLREIIRLRYGLGGREPHTLQEIADRIDLTRERVRQLERDALKILKLRAPKFHF